MEFIGCAVTCSLGCATMLLGCADGVSVQQQTAPVQHEYGLPMITDEEPRSYSGLSQVVAFQDWLFSGSKPSGEAGFQSLANLRVRTIVCVDGTPPDHLTGDRYGMKTFHIPLKYGEPTQLQILDLATAVREGMTRGNIYVHCHHGKHRSAAASAIALLALNRSTAEVMKNRMVVAETSQYYSGLWDAVDKTRKLNESDLIQNETNLTNRVHPEGITNQMIAIDFAMDNLKLIKQSNWITPKRHPDLVPAAEAGTIAESFRQLRENHTTAGYPRDFSQKLDEASNFANTLEQEIILGEATSIELSSSMRALSKSCIACHLAYRK